MAITITNESGALLIAYCLAGLSLWTMSGDKLTRYSRETVMGVSEKATEEKQVRIASIWRQHASLDTGHSIQLVNPFREHHRLAEYLQWQSGTNVNPRSPDEPELSAGKAKEMRELRRRAVIALVVVALLGSPNVNVVN